MTVATCRVTTRVQSVSTRGTALQCRLSSAFGEGNSPLTNPPFLLYFLGAPPPIPKPATPGTRVIPAALGAAPTAPSGRVPKAPSTKARPPPPRISAPVGSYKPRPAPPKVPAASARVASKPPARKEPKRQFDAAEYVTQDVWPGPSFNSP